MAILPTEKEGDLLLQTLHDAKHGSSKPMLIPQGKEQVEENFIDTGPSSLGPGEGVHWWTCVDTYIRMYTHYCVYVTHVYSHKHAHM